MFNLEKEQQFSKDNFDIVVNSMCNTQVVGKINGRRWERV